MVTRTDPGTDNQVDLAKHLVGRERASSTVDSKKAQTERGEIILHLKMSLPAFTCQVVIWKTKNYLLRTYSELARKFKHVGQISYFFVLRFSGKLEETPATSFRGSFANS